MWLLRRRRRRPHVTRISTLFIRAAARGALFGSLLKQEGRAALRALFDDGLVPINRLTFGIFRTAIEGFAALGSFDDKLALAAGTGTRDPGGLAFDVLALRIIRTGDELTKTTNSLH